MIAKFNTSTGTSESKGSNTLLIILGAAALCYIGYRYFTRKKEEEKQITND